MNFMAPDLIRVPPPWAIAHHLIQEWVRSQTSPAASPTPDTKERAAKL